MPLTFKPGILERAEYAPYVRLMDADNAKLYARSAELEAAIKERIAYAALTRGNPLKKLFNIICAGNNGKSAAWSRAQACMGEDFVTVLGAAQLVGRSNPTAPNPHMRSALQANMTAVEEPAKGQQVCAAQIKEMSGGTKQKVRNLFDHSSSLPWAPEDKKMATTRNYDVFTGDEYVENRLYWCRAWRVLLLRRIASSRLEYHEHWSHGYFAYQRDMCLGAWLAGKHYAAEVFRHLCAGIKILGALRRNVREAKTRGAIMAAMALRVLSGPGGIENLRQLLPYFNHYTWPNRALFGREHRIDEPSHTELSVKWGELEYTITGFVPLARNVHRPLVF